MIEWLDTLQEALKPYPWAYSAIVAGVLILVAFLVNWITKRILLRGLQRLLSTLPAHDSAENKVRLAIISRLALRGISSAWATYLSSRVFFSAPMAVTPAALPAGAGTGPGPLR